jgi:Scavenger mRNA decapping enzyme C-term binding
MKKLLLIVPIVAAFLGGVAVGGYLFAQSQPRSFLALRDCGKSCYREKELAGLLVSSGIQRAPGLIPKVLKETDKCVAIADPYPEARFHAIIFPKKDIRDIADVSVEDAPYVLDCIGVIRSLILEHKLRYYRVHVNGPGYQDVTYLHFHLISK